MDDAAMLTLLRQDLQRAAADPLPGEDEYLTHLLLAAKTSLERQGCRKLDLTDDDWYQTVIATAAWMYRKRITGESEPQYLRRMRLDLIVSRQAGGGGNAT